METEVFSSEGAGANTGTAGAAKPPGHPGDRMTTAPVTARFIDGRPEDRHTWAIAALLVPLVFCAIVGAGVFLMFHRDMGYFKPAPSGSAAPQAPAVAWAPGARPGV